MNTMNLGCFFFVMLVVIATCNSTRVSNQERRVAEAVVNKVRLESRNPGVKLVNILESSSKIIRPGVTEWKILIVISYGKISGVEVRSTCRGIVIDGIRPEPQVMQHKCTIVRTRNEPDEDEDEEEDEEEGYARLFPVPAIYLKQEE